MRPSATSSGAFGMFEAIKSQVRVIAALTLRDMQNQNNNLVGGFAWAIIDVLLYVGAMSLIRVFIKAFMPPGMPPFTFLVLGIIPWQTFDHTMKTIENIVRRNGQLLSLPIVTPLDIAVSAALDKLCTYGIIFAGLMLLCMALEGGGPPRFPLGVILIFLASWVMGLSFGLVMVPLYRMFPPTKWLWKPFKRAWFWTSGLYFVITSMPANLWPYMTWNPILHINELMRTYWFQNYNTPIGSPTYVVLWLMGLVLFGLSLERFIRRVPA
jgi:capsular polysaccharide transport system permease protein